MEDNNLKPKDMKLFRTGWSLIFQLIASVFMIYYGFIKKEILPSDVTHMLFWCAIYLVQEIRQLSLKFEPDDE